MSEQTQSPKNTLDDLVFVAHKKFEKAESIATEAKKKHRAARIEAGAVLLDLRSRIEAGEAGEISWWEWYGQKFVRSRGDAEKVMALASAEDPQAAYEAKKVDDAAASQAYRDRKKPQVVSVSPAEDSSVESIPADVSGKKSPTKSKTGLKVVSVTQPKPMIRWERLELMKRDFLDLTRPERAEYVRIIKRVYRD